MVRSLSFIHLFIILAVGYIGGALLFREVPVSASEKLIGFFDPRVVALADGALARPLFTLVGFLLVVFLLSMNSKSRYVVLLIGAMKCVLFGLSSSYLLASGMKLVTYTIWWFPFQMLICMLFLLYCIVLSPPYFQRIAKKQRNVQAIPVIVGVYLVIILIEMTIYHFFVR